MGGAVAPAGRPRLRMDPGARLAAAALLCAAAPAAATSQPGTGRFDEEGVQRDVDTDKSIALSIAVLAGLLAVCVFSAVVAPKWFGVGGRRPADQQQQRKTKKAVTSEEILERLPPAKTPRNSDGGGQPSCVVCLCEVDVDEESITTQCGHVFHKECVLQWWTHKPRRSIRCPTCRTKQKIRSKSRDGTPRSQAHPTEAQPSDSGDDEQAFAQPLATRQESWVPDLEEGRRAGSSLMLPVNIAHSPFSSATTAFTHMSVADEATPASQISAMPPMPLSRSQPATGSVEVVETV